MLPKYCNTKYLVVKALDEKKKRYILYHVKYVKSTLTISQVSITQNIKTNYFCSLIIQLKTNIQPIKLYYH